jgi:hypothetical protein
MELAAEFRRNRDEARETLTCWAANFTSRVRYKERYFGFWQMVYEPWPNYPDRADRHRMRVRW